MYLKESKDLLKIHSTMFEFETILSFARHQDCNCRFKTNEIIEVYRF